MLKNLDNDSTEKRDELRIIGWREWVSLPELGIKRIKAKIDTGARTSVLHAFEVSLFQEDGKDKVRFTIHPKQASTAKVLTCVATLFDIRKVTDSGGHKEQRYVIKTPVAYGDSQWPTEITLTSRDDMRFRMLLGRTALQGHFLIDASASYLLKKI